MTSRHFAPAASPLRGLLAVPGDKSISHRAVLFGAMAEGVSRARGVLDSADVRSSIGAVAALGARVDVVDAPGGLDVSIEGWGGGGPTTPDAPVDCGNSGTTARLLMGILAGWPVEVTIAGDESLSRRPMARVTGPLGDMGAAFEAREGGLLPVTVRGRFPLEALSYASPVASAQVKTAILLAGLRAEGRTLVTEPASSRDHTERLLPSFGVGVGRSEDCLTAWLDGPVLLRRSEIIVPSDPSSAAFFVGAALIVPGSEILLHEVALNPTRTGFLRVLERMGADVESRVTGVCGGELVGEIRARRGPLRATVVESDEIPSLVDEVPILAIVASRAEGRTLFKGVGELRVKESDRLAAVADALRALGVPVREGEDWLEVAGPSKLGGAELDPHGDHRLAMAYAVAGLVSEEGVTVRDFECVAVSYPHFAEDVERLSQG